MKLIAPPCHLTLLLMDGFGVNISLRAARFISLRFKQILARIDPPPPLRIRVKLFVVGTDVDRNQETVPALRTQSVQGKKKL